MDDDTATIDNSNDNDKHEAVPLAEQLMNRGEFLRQLREMELADQAERDQHAITLEETTPSQSTRQQQQQGEDVIYTLANQKKVLCYDSFLKHQRYYDDLKHVDCQFIDFGSMMSSNNSGGRLVMEQDKSLGKGGLCWDAAFILAEHLIQHEQEWNHSNSNNNTPTFVVELGSGTGLCGCMIAKAVTEDCRVQITDLPELLPLMTRNVQRNFDSNHVENDNFDSPKDENFASQTNIDDEELLYELLLENDTTQTTESTEYARGTISARVLKWGDSKHYPQDVDVVLGADVVASLYDPIALAETMHALCHDKSIVYVSFKERLTGPHEQFEERLESLFTTVKRIRPTSRNRNPQVWILKATGKKMSAASS